MTLAAWDMFRAELYDTIRGQDQHPAQRPCVYCSAPTRSRYQVCLAHDDLIELDPGYPAALESADVSREPQPSAPAVSSAALPSPSAALPAALAPQPTGD